MSEFLQFLSMLAVPVTFFVTMRHLNRRHDGAAWAPERAVEHAPMDASA